MTNIVLIASILGSVLYFLSLLPFALRSLIITQSTLRDQLFNATNACLNVIQEVGVFGVSISLLFASLATYLMIRVLIASIRTYQWYRETVSTIEGLEIVAIDPDRIVFKASTPVAFTSGLLFPKIYISSWFIENFNKDELSALILHEEYHRIHLHPFMILINHFITESIPFYSGSSSFRSLLEIAADNYVRSQLGTSLPLLQGLKKGLERYSEYRIENLAVASLTIDSERLSNLTDSVSKYFYIKTLGSALSTLFVVPALLLLLNFQSSVSGVYAVSTLPVGSYECELYNEINMSVEIQTIDRFFTPS